jgi:peptidoglycan hydrolase CwlO-like protein
MGKDLIVQNIALIIIFVGIVFGVTVIMDMARDTQATKNYIIEDKKRIQLLENVINGQATLGTRVDDIEKLIPEHNEKFMKLGAKLDTLEVQIKVLLDALADKTKDAR